MTKKTISFQAYTLKDLSDVLNTFNLNNKVFATQVFHIEKDRYEALVYYEGYP